MSSVKPLVRATYSGYHAPNDFQPDDFLTRVGRGTPCGEYLRRFWQPVAFVQELTEVPLRVRILGEDLVMFRDLGGRIGLLNMHCSHRGASLEFGVISERGIRCFYHGWHYDIDGTVLDTPAGKPLDAAGKICHGAYPVHVFNDLIFTYMGPPDRKPPFPLYDFYNNPNLKIVPAIDRTHVVECNWLQIVENGIDPAHTAFLHVIVSGRQPNFSDEMGILPLMRFRTNDVGVYYVASRRVGDNVWVRIVETLMPNVAQLAVDNQKATRENVSQLPFLSVWAVPIDDYNTKRISLLFDDVRQPLSAEQKRRAFGQIADRPYIERQRKPGDYDAQVSQGPINIHDYENLATSDQGIVLYREMLKQGIHDVQAGRDPVGVFRDQNKVIRTRSQNTVLRAPAAASPEQDQAMIEKIGNEVAEADYRNQFPPV